MPTNQQNAQLLMDIIVNPGVPEADKVTAVRNVLTTANLSFEDYIQVSQNEGHEQSPVRVAIILGLPQVFGVFQEFGQQMKQFHLRNTTANHHYADLVTLMEQNVAFSSSVPGNFGYSRESESGGVMTRSGLSCKNEYSWLHYYAGELDIEIGAERGHAKGRMRAEGILVPIPVGREEEVERTLIFSRRPSGTLVCRQGFVPEGNTLQEYETDPRTGYRRYKPAA